MAARQLAVDALVRIDSGGAYANLTLPPMLERSGLSDRDRAFVTELVYGTTRMQRSCDPGVRVTRSLRPTSARTPAIRSPPTVE